MRIDSTRLPGILPQQTAASHRAPARRPDSVHLWSAGLSADPQKIDRLTAAVRAGTYRVPAMQLAASIINWTMPA